MNIESIPVPDKFPPGCEFFDTYGGDDRVVFPDGKIFALSNDGSTLEPRSMLPRSASLLPSTESAFLSYAKSYRSFAARTIIEKHKVQLDLESALSDLGNLFGESSKLKITQSECDKKLIRSCTQMSHPDFPVFLTDKQPIESVLQSLEFESADFGYKRKFHDVEFSAGESFSSWFLIRAGSTTKLSWTPPHDINIFTPIAPIELMATIYKLWAETYDQKEPFDIIKGPIDSFLLLGKKWIDYRKEVNALIPQIPTIWAEREFLRNALNYIEHQHDWVDVDYDIKFSHIPGQLRISAKNTEVYCPARGNLIGEVNVSAKALFRNLPKRFIGDVVSLQFKGNKLVIYSREFPARWSEQNDH